MKLLSSDISPRRFLLYANTIHITVLFVVVNVALAVLFLVKDQLSASGAKTTTTIKRALFADTGTPIDNGRRTYYQWLDYSVYQAIADQVYVDSVLDDFTSFAKLGFVYQPWVQFSEPPYDGKLLHVDTDANGLSLRRTVNPSGQRAALLRILVLGGSTTFGYHVSDEHTWPSYLSAVLNERATQLGLALRIEVMNYGRAYYYSTQEMFLLAQLLKGGQRPNLVVFLDGLNEWTCSDVPQFTQKIAEATHNLQFERALSPVDQFGWLPIVRLAKAISRWTASPPSSPSPDQTADDCKGSIHMAGLAERYRQSVEMARAISKLYGISTLFFLQPDATVHYSPALYRLNLPTELSAMISYIRRVKPEFYRMVRGVEGVIDLTNLFELWGPTRKAVIDDLDYSPQFNLFLAQHIANHIDLVWLANSGAIDAGTDGEVRSSR